MTLRRGAFRAPVVKHGLRAALTFAIGAVLLWALAGQLSHIEPEEVALALGALPLWSWGLAIGFTALSFWAVGQYDVVIHRHMRTGLSPARARRAGVAAIAVSQMIGLGVVSGAVIRARLLPQVSLTRAFTLTAAVAASFLAAWAMVTALVLVILPGAPFKGLAALALVALLMLAALSAFGPARVLGPRFSTALPNLYTMGRLLMLTAVDTGAAALAFLVLCPEGAGIGLVVLLPAFLLALGAGLASGTPGGMGAFELTLFALLPTGQDSDLVAAVLAFRLVYYALPAILGALVAIRGAHGLAGEADRPDGAAMARASGSAEHRLMAQGGLEAVGRSGQGFWAVGRSRHLLAALIGPLAAPGGAAMALRALSRAAAAEQRAAVIYKAPARLAALAREQGFVALPLSREAVIDPQVWTQGAPACAGLRRKLRKAEAAGIRVLLPREFVPDWAEMAALSAGWAARQGGERGFSMGRYSQAYCRGQRIYQARVEGRLLGFVTFHDGPGEWVLDLMRHGPDMPDGTMQALIARAIGDARTAGVTRLTLAAAPEAAFSRPVWLIRAERLRLFRADQAGTGLRQFKEAFAPRWERRYLLAPSRPVAILAALEIGRAILRPGPLPAAPGTEAAPATMPPVEHDHARYAFAPVR